MSTLRLENYNSLVDNSQYNFSIFKGYGIAMAHGTPYKVYIDMAILKLQETGVLHKMKTKWWKRKRGGGINILSLSHPIYIQNCL